MKRALRSRTGRWSLRAAVLVAISTLGGAVACGTEEPADTTIELEATPAHASMFGHVELTVRGDLAAVGDVRTVSIGGVRALGLKPVDGGLTMTLQGAPEPGLAEIVIEGTAGTRQNRTAFRYDEPTSGVPRRWMAFGASLTHGTQSGGLDAHGQLMGYAPQIARAAGVYLGLPLVVDGAIPTMPAADVAQDCNLPVNYGKLAKGVLDTIWDASEKHYDLSRARQDPTLSYRNVAVGGATVADVIEGSKGVGHILERIMELPDGDPLEYTSDVTKSQLGRLVALDPDVALSADLLANDVMAVFVGDDILIEKATDPAIVEQGLRTLMDAIGKLHGHYFVATLFDVTKLPSVPDLRDKRVAERTDTIESFDAKVAAVRARVAADNDALIRAASPHENIHVLDLAREAAPILESGYDLSIDGAPVHLSARRFGGMLSFDHMHFSDSGYAILGSYFVRAINAQLGVHIPDLDVAAVYKADPFSPPNLVATGIHCGNPLWTDVVVTAPANVALSR